MQRKLAALILLIFIPQLIYAEICPSVADIKKNSLQGWKAYDGYDDKVLAPIRLASFKNRIDKFVLAEWASENNKNGAIHCYYVDKEGSTLDVYLRKENFHPDYAQNHWYKVTGSMQCAESMEKCKFLPELAHEATSNFSAAKSVVPPI